MTSQKLEGPAPFGDGREAMAQHGIGMPGNDKETTSSTGAQYLKMAPMPSRGIGGRFKQFAMSNLEVRHWIESYNAWVTLWNTHERSKSLPLSPPWYEAGWQLGHFVGLPDTCLVFQLRGSTKMGAIRLAGWTAWAKGWSFCRIPADPKTVVWACWLEPKSKSALPYPTLEEVRFRPRDPEVCYD